MQYFISKCALWINSANTSCQNFNSGGYGTRHCRYFQFLSLIFSAHFKAYLLQVQGSSRLPSITLASPPLCRQQHRPASRPLIVCRAGRVSVQTTSLPPPCHPSSPPAHRPLTDRNRAGWHHLVDLHSVWSLKLELRDRSLLPVWCDKMRKNKQVKVWNEILEVTFKVTYCSCINWWYAENKDKYQNTWELSRFTGCYLASKMQISRPSFTLNFSNHKL